MDLLKLNNEISGMRPAARQAKVHVIHFLTKNAAKLDKRKGKEEDIAKSKKKATRLQEEALIDKILTQDEITKFSLQFDSSLRDKILNDTNIPLSAKAFVRIASHQIMVQAVKNFREKYPDWPKWLEKSLEKLGTGSRFGSKMKNGRVKAHMTQRQRVEEAMDTIRRFQMTWLYKSGNNEVKVKEETKSKSNCDEDIENKKNTKLKTEKKTISSDDEDIVNKKDNHKKPSADENINERRKNEQRRVQSKSVHYEELNEEDDSDEEMEVGESEENEESTGEEEKESDIGEEIKAEESEEHEGESSGAFDESDDNEESDSENGEKKENKNQTGNKDKATAGKILKNKRNESGKKNVFVRSKEAEVCRFADLLKKEEQNKHIDEDSDEEFEDGSSSLKSEDKGVDPFFMTRNNDFLRLATAKREEKPKEIVREGPKWGVEGCENWTGTRSERRARAFGRPVPKRFRRDGPWNVNTPPAQNRGGSVRNARAETVGSVQDEPEKLHPSWAAKRQMHVSVAAFQGKKVKFDDSD